jgi:hypothetical protein
MGKQGDGTLAGRMDGLSGLELGIELCTALLRSVGRDGFHGGVRPDNITMTGPKPVLGPPLTHETRQFTRQELEFMAPELFWSGRRSPAADVYSVGLTPYAFYNGGSLPFWPAGREPDTGERVEALQKRMRGEDVFPPAEAARNCESFCCARSPSGPRNAGAMRRNSVTPWATAAFRRTGRHRPPPFPPSPWPAVRWTAPTKNSAKSSV